MKYRTDSSNCQEAEQLSALVDRNDALISSCCRALRRELELPTVKIPVEKEAVAPPVVPAVKFGYRWLVLRPDPADGHCIFHVRFQTVELPRFAAFPCSQAAIRRLSIVPGNAITRS
jgi:hypothetical protein